MLFVGDPSLHFPTDDYSFLEGFARSRKYNAEQAFKTVIFFSLY